MTTRRSTRGRGVHLNRDYRVELDASITEGSRLAAGAVAAVEGVRHPVTLARRVMELLPRVMLAGAGARAFAREVGAEPCRTRGLLVGRELDRYLRVMRGERDLITGEDVQATKPRSMSGKGPLC